MGRIKGFIPLNEEQRERTGKGRYGCDVKSRRRGSGREGILLQGLKGGIDAPVHVL